MGSQLRTHCSNWEILEKQKAPAAFVLRGQACLPAGRGWLGNFLVGAKFLYYVFGYQRINLIIASAIQFFQRKTAFLA